jgi:hypothetical protein
LFQNHPELDGIKMYWVSCSYFICVANHGNSSCWLPSTSYSLRYSSIWPSQSRRNIQRLEPSPLELGWMLAVRPVTVALLHGDIIIQQLWKKNVGSDFNIIHPHWGLVRSLTVFL